MGIILPKLIADGMVLQRNAKIRIWGKSDVPVTLSFLGKRYEALPDPSGHWEILLRDLQPGGPYTMQINEITLKDVHVGDVWLCSGQSNMQIPMSRVKHMYPEEIESPNPHIRQFTVPQNYDFHGPLDSLDGGQWTAASPGTIRDFSAVGYFFAKRLYERYQIPIGLILSAVGGTPIHAWMSRGALENFPDLIQEADLYADDGYVARIQAEEAKRWEIFYGGVDAADPGLAEKWYSPEYNDEAWEERDLLDPWPGTGSVWLRKTLRIPPGLAGKKATLFLGTLVDWDMVYVNGQAVGNTTYQYPPREYTIPSLPEGRCVIAIRVISKNGGRFTPGKQYLLVTDKGSFNLNGTWRFRRGAQASPPTPEVFLYYKPAGLYNGMIAPLKRFAVKGALWYQGEADADNPERYAEKFKALVNAWRADWGYELPFLFVELPHWEGGPHWHLMRQQQRLALDIPGTAMAAAFDLGEHNDLHPQGKQAVGDRLARCAMRLVYGETLPHSPFEIMGCRESDTKS